MPLLTMIRIHNARSRIFPIWLKSLSSRSFRPVISYELRIDFISLLFNQSSNLQLRRILKIRCAKISHEGPVSIEPPWGLRYNDAACRYCTSFSSRTLISKCYRRVLVLSPWYRRTWSLRHNIPNLRMLVLAWKKPWKFGNLVFLFAIAPQNKIKIDHSNTTPNIAKPNTHHI